jgi:hypothetical protein
MVVFTENFQLRFSTLGTDWNHPLRKEWRNIGMDPAIYGPMQIFGGVSLIAMVGGTLGAMVFRATLSPEGDPAPWINIDLIRMCYWSGLIGSIGSLVSLIPNFIMLDRTFGNVFGRDLPKWLDISQEELLGSTWVQIQEHARRRLILHAKDVLELEAMPRPSNPFGEERKGYDERLNNVRMDFRWKHGNLQSLRLVAKNSPFDKYFDEAEKLMKREGSKSEASQAVVVGLTAIADNPALLRSTQERDPTDF